MTSLSVATEIVPEWWRQAVVYQVYPRSFSDSNADGLGDIAGITEKVGYLKRLGVDAIWLSPFYPSELADGGYDVADYRNVDPRLGTLEDFDEMVRTLHDAGIKVVVDIVPNHTSDQHEWFQAALAASPGSPERDRYIFRKGLGESGEIAPADWVSVFGGPSWSPVGDGYWYLHTFAREQPDLNWNNAEVRADFVKTLKFWSDRGVDGFRIDVANALAKDLPERLPSWEELNAIPVDGNHPTTDRDDVHEIYAEWRKVFNSYDPPRTAVAEAWVHPDRIARYASPESLGQAFNFDLLQADFDAKQFKRIVSHNLDLAAKSGSSSTWVLSNHDVVRHATRYGLPNSPRDEEGKVLHQSGTGFDWLLTGGSEPELDLQQGLRRARAATLVLFALPGSTYIYQGEELGLHEVAQIAPEERQDPTFFRTNGEEIGRDGCRVPIPWVADSPSFGFGAGGSHLPQPEWFADYAADVEDTDPNSMLNLYRAALALRRELQTDEELEWLDTGDQDLLSFRRANGWRVVANFGSEAKPLLVGEDEVALASLPLPDNGTIPGETTVWLRR
ncbi:alpha-amylase family glycosyl hydrolase [Actinomycetaceae bacterium MB13-C1-2]|nr:alpha-amylase family glycosyl hydrolase [Actinomycetaceae bacterium MB13-C1-2]